MVFRDNTSAVDIRDEISSHFSIPVDDFYLIQNGRLLNTASTIKDGPNIQAIPKLVGGKGGFGSMLRAIGAQIEKTTNKEACRDLSGRRLRDINEEKRLKTWIAQQAERERQEADKKQRKIEKLRAQPKHEFSDKQYEEERSQLIDKVHDAVEHGFQSLVPNTLSEASSSAEPSTSAPSTSAACSAKPAKKKPKKKGFMFEDEELSLSESDSDIEKDVSCSEKNVSPVDKDVLHVDKNVSSVEQDASSEEISNKRAAEADTNDTPTKKQKTEESNEIDSSKSEVAAVSL